MKQKSSKIFGDETMCDMEGYTIRLGSIAPNVCPESLKNLAAGKVMDRIFYPMGSVAFFYYEKEKEYRNSKSTVPSTNVYLIQSTQGGPVKIGKSKNVQSRLDDLQMVCPFPLRLLKVWNNVHPSFERRLHKKYVEYRLHGEWFNESILPFLLEEIS